jgi:uncharacterized protein
MFVKPEFITLKERMSEERRFMQVLMGPRQVGKTTLVKQLVAEIDFPYLFVAADGVANSDFDWISLQWETLRIKMKQADAKEGLLIIDEIQKIQNWAEITKAEWDRDSFEDRPIKVILLGSSRLLLQQGLTESLAGRFEIIQMNHWTFSEMRGAFGFTVDEFVWFGGYPGAATLVQNEDRWREYILNAMVETTISKDILMLTRIDKPAVLRRLFEIGSAYSGKIVSVSKILGELQDAGNTTTLSNYLELLDSAGLLSGLERYTPALIRQRASIPKWQVQNTAYSSSLSTYSFDEAKMRPDVWGQHVETAIGAYLTRAARLGEIKLYYWREGNYEMDFVIERRGKVIGLEVKGGLNQKAKGIEKFKSIIKPDKVLMVGRSGIPWQEFLEIDIKSLF